ncbi:MAG TPA: LuxR C-terminal-related transcriptional regulator [Dinghuibacter sp.]|uniref:response regulator transcription factor n=1 Tax=Dinghuibacter sp. TaxID=2024697 RepID=UPI002CCAD307|nr:LuxR C-terminal-related transcriptional regulator [Dinghuibacter sp.]HTJ14005.1 LuxR C-terminal-related transcriptional regulator [Dinghuibacter sp.]
MYIVICNPHGNTVEPEAAAFLASASGIRGIAAAAIVAPDHVTWQQGNAVVEVCMPGIPAALCQDISAAEKWLRDVMLANPHGATVRQKQVLKLVEKRFSHKEIAFKLGCKKRTVETHLYELQHRFGVTSVRDLIEAARQTGLLPLLNGSSS